MQYEILNLEHFEPYKPNVPVQDVPSAALGGGGGGGSATASGGSRGPVILKRGGGNQGEMSVEDF